MKIAFGIFATCSLVGCSCSGSKSSGNVIQQLATPTNVQFTDSDYILKWDAVEHADKYRIDINGKSYETESNTYKYVPIVTETIFKVRALDSSLEYIDSNWSNECSYTVVQNEFSIASLNVFANGLYNGADLERVISFYKNDNKLYIYALYSDNSVYVSGLPYQSTITSLKSIIAAKDYGTQYNPNGMNHVTSRIGKIKNYDSMSYFLQRTTYKQLLETYRLEGYSFEVVSSVAIENQEAEGLLKLTKDQVEKYISFGFSFYPSSTIERDVYTTEIVNLDNEHLVAKHCAELTDDFVDCAKIVFGV